ncbi:TetR/AcrR family transcriptional regulator [Hoylesella oralis]|uniref:TetR/AcrR family transcriptional regulator n=1 Tax=Hoylesella oralis TaxID=28134 RepID=UPI0028EC6008|nr:TetR/AcrR family transcriptional regulator [Hoylesella oralis]
MQMQKNFTRKQILHSAEKLFVQKGFRSTSMREIAMDAGVGLSNIYNYFENKDRIFRTLLMPLTDELDRMLVEHHDPKSVERLVPELNSMGERFITDMVSEYLHVVTRYRRQLQLLFFKAQGSSLENFIDDFSKRCVEQIQVFMQQIRRNSAGSGTAVADFTIRLHTVWMLTLFKEMARQNMSPHDRRQIFTDYVTFECVGWRERINR